MRIQPLIYNFEYQRKGNTRKSIKGRFAQSDAIKKHWSQYDNISSYENPHRKDTRNEVLGFRKFARAFNKINTTHEIVDVNDYVMQLYRNNFITDQGNQILDVKDIDISNPEELEILINSIAGVVDNGIFAKNKPQVVLVSE